MWIDWQLFCQSCCDSKWSRTRKCWVFN